MNILGIDYGRRKVGVAVATISLAEPHSVIHYKHTNELFRKLKALIQEFDIKKVIIGISEGKMAIETSNFAKVLEKELGVDAEVFDETLTTLNAQALSREAGIKQKKRRIMEDAFAATLMLQGYLDSNP